MAPVAGKVVMPVQPYHDSRDIRYRSPAGAQPCGTRVTLRLRITGGTPDKVQLRLWFGKESFHPMTPAAGDDTLYEAEICLPSEPCLLWYDFQIWQGHQFTWYGNAEDLLGGEGASVWGEARSYQITVYSPDFQAPAWTQGGVFYQIFPDRFARGEKGANLPLPKGRHYHENWDEKPLLMMDPETGDNVAHDYFGGTLSGIREKLPYLQSLGITALYLNPIFHAGTNHRFDTTDWMAIDPTLGTKEDFEALCRDAERLGIHIVLDGVFSHSGDHSPFFQNARAVEDSPYRNWYRFEHWPDMYKSWWGFTTLPELNKHQPEVIDYFLTGDDAVVKSWVRAGSDGWRIDVADELPMPYLQLLHAAVKAQKKDAIVIGEVWEDASNKISYGEMRCYCFGDTLDGVMNYPLREVAIAYLLGEIDAALFKRRMDSLYENYPVPFAQSLMNVLGSHDRARALNVLSGMNGKGLTRQEQAYVQLTPEQRALGIKRLKLLLELIVAMPGMPCVYYGDEAGMEGCADPFSRGTFPWGNEDASLTEYFRQALARRRTVGALTDGTLTIEAPCADILCVVRSTPTERAITVINRSDHAKRVTLEGKNLTVAAYGCARWEA